MLRIGKSHIATILLIATWITSAASAQYKAVTVEAESGILGSRMSSNTLDGVGYITVLTNIESGNTNNPNSANRLASYSVTFPEAGDWILYARFRVGSGGGNDDSFFYGNSFGNKNATHNSDWNMVNGLDGGGYTAPDAIVADEGGRGTQVWKWLRFSDFEFTVREGNYTQTFQVGGRETGLFIDKIAFGLKEVAYSVDQLDSGTSGIYGGIDFVPAFVPVGPSLAAGKSKFLGCIWAGPGSETNFDVYFNQVTPENAGKWGSVQPDRYTFNWEDLDAAYSYAKSRGYLFRFHVLVWGSQQPGWMQNLPQNEQLEALEAWMAAVAKRYPNIDYLEVVNEALSHPPRLSSSPNGDTGNYYDALGGAGDTGWDWVINAFKMAKRHFPDTKLMINDYSIISGGSRLERYVGLIELLKSENLLDVVGIQCHSFSLISRTAQTLTNSFNRLDDPGLPIMVTEMELDGLLSNQRNGTDGEDTTVASDQRQLDRFQIAFPSLWEHPAVIGITFWGYRFPIWRDDWDAHLVFLDGRERPAMEWLVDYMRASETISLQEYLTQRNLDIAIHSFNADIDQDGLTTGMEFFLGSDPETMSTVQQSISFDAGNMRIEVNAFKDLGEGYVTIEQSTNLQDWTPLASYNWSTRTSNGLDLKFENDYMTVVFQNSSNTLNNKFYRYRYSLTEPE